VFGVPTGASGYTTAGEARTLARELRVGRGDLLLDLGSGAGWPALYIARVTGCSLVLSDVPRAELIGAAIRARRARINRRCTTIVASGDRPPFRRQTFDAITHADVLC
jgi:cyclopropane fatty-acyl-phospholipid synthase-like methyltransferase